MNCDVGESSNWENGRLLCWEESPLPNGDVRKSPNWDEGRSPPNNDESKLPNGEDGLLPKKDEGPSLLNNEEVWRWGKKGPLRCSVVNEDPLLSGQQI